MTDISLAKHPETAIFTDTSANLSLTPPLAKGIRIIPLAYSIEGKEQHQDPQTGLMVTHTTSAYEQALR